MALIEGLLRGKEVHFTEPDIEVVIYPPNGNVVMTRDQYHELLREAEYKGMRSFISMLESVNQMKVIKKEAEQVSSENTIKCGNCGEWKILDKICEHCGK